MPIPLPPGELFKVIQRYISRGGVEVDRYRPFIQETVVPTFDIIAAGHTSGVRTYVKNAAANGLLTVVTVPDDELWKVTHWYATKLAGTYTIDELDLQDKWLGSGVSVPIDNVTAATTIRNTRGALEIWSGPGANWQLDIVTLTLAGNVELDLVLQVWKVTGKI